MHPLTSYNLARFQVACTRLAALLGGLITVFAFLYGAFLLGAVAHTAAQTTIERQVAKTSSAVNTLETQYFMMTRTITPERAAALGFTTPKQTTIIFATAASKALSLQGLSTP
jgi:hypothetical protein